MWSVPSSGYRRYLPHQGWRGSSLWCNDCSCGPLILSPASSPAFRGLEFCGSHSFAASAWFRFFLLQGRLGTIEKNDYNADKNILIRVLRLYVQPLKTNPKVIALIFVEAYICCIGGTSTRQIRLWG